MKKRFWVAEKITNVIVLSALTVLIVFLLRGAREELKRLEVVNSQNEIATPAPTIPRTDAPTRAPSAEPTPSETPEPSPSAFQPLMAQKILAARETFDNDEIVGYLDVPDTGIQYYVTQAEDNYYYLSHNIEKREDNAGWVFLDYENDWERDDWNSIIYGHNMRAEIMFHGLRNYRDAEFFNEHPFFYFNTVNGDYVYEIFSVFETLPDAFQYNTVYFGEKENFEEMIAKTRALSKYDTSEISVSADDRVTLLSTCSNTPDDKRLVVAGKLVLKDELIPKNEFDPYAYQ
jgi:SrtB family sortase